MEAAQFGGREADIAPAPATVEPAGWTPADPLPLGIAGFALTTFMLSVYNAGWVSMRGSSIVFAVALAYGGLAQLLAGMWEFRRGNTFAAAAFSSYGAFWISLFAFAQFFAKGITNPADANNALALYLYSWGIFTTYMFIASLRTTGAVALVFLLLAITYWLLGVGKSAPNTTIFHLGGYFGIATAIAAWYAAFATVTNSTFHRTVLPLWPLDR